MAVRCTYVRANRLGNLASIMAKTPTTVIRLPEDKKKALADKAKAENTSLSDQLRKAITAYLRVK